LTEYDYILVGVLLNGGACVLIKLLIGMAVDTAFWRPPNYIGYTVFYDGCLTSTTRVHPVDRISAHIVIHVRPARYADRIGPQEAAKRGRIHPRAHDHQAQLGHVNPARIAQTVGRATAVRLAVRAVAVGLDARLVIVRDHAAALVGGDEARVGTATVHICHRPGPRPGQPAPRDTARPIFGDQPRSRPPPAARHSAVPGHLIRPPDRIVDEPEHHPRARRRDQPVIGCLVTQLSRPSARSGKQRRKKHYDSRDTA